MTPASLPPDGPLWVRVDSLTVGDFIHPQAHDDAYGEVVGIKGPHGPLGTPPSEDWYTLRVKYDGDTHPTTVGPKKGDRAVRSWSASLPPDGEPQTNPYRTHLEGPGLSIRYDDNRGGGPGAGMQNAAAMAWDEGFAAGAAARTAEIVKWLRTTKGDEWMRGQDAARSVVSRFGGGES